MSYDFCYRYIFAQMGVSLYASPSKVSLVAKTVKNLPAMQETQV